MSSNNAPTLTVRSTNYAKTFKKIVAPTRRTLSNTVKGYVGIPSRTCLGLYYAIQDGRFEKVKEYIARGADLNCVIEQFHSDGETGARISFTPLLKAIYEEDFDIVRLLVASGAIHNRRVWYYNKWWGIQDTDIPLLQSSSDEIRKFLISLPANPVEAKLAAQKSLVDLPPPSNFPKRGKYNGKRLNDKMWLKGLHHRVTWAFGSRQGDDILIKKRGAPVPTPVKGDMIWSPN